MTTANNTNRIHPATSAGLTFLAIYLAVAYQVYINDIRLQSDTLFVLAYYSFRALLATWAADKAAEKGLEKTKYGIWCFFFPSITLIVIGQSKSNGK